MIEMFLIKKIYVANHVIYKQFIVLALMQNELYLIVRSMKEIMEDMILITKSIVDSKVRNVVNCK